MRALPQNEQVSLYINIDKQEYKHDELSERSKVYLCELSAGSCIMINDFHLQRRLLRSSLHLVLVE